MWHTIEELADMMQISSSSKNMLRASLGLSLHDCVNAMSTSFWILGRLEHRHVINFKMFGQP
jgi:hypothetical protein